MQAKVFEAINGKVSVPPTVPGLQATKQITLEEALNQFLTNEVADKGRVVRFFAQSESTFETTRDTTVTVLYE